MNLKLTLTITEGEGEVAFLAPNAGIVEIEQA